MRGEARWRLNALRLERAMTCEACVYGRSCSRLPIIEALPSERTFDHEGRLECAIARPMIDFMVEQIEGNADALELINRHKSLVLDAPPF
jgi:uncharacterized protein